MPTQRIQEVGKFGLLTDPLPSALPPEAWSACHNIVFRDGYARSTWGQRKLFDLHVEPIWHYELIDPGGFQWIIITDGVTVLAYDNAGTKYDITPAGVALVHAGARSTSSFQANLVTFANYNSILVMNSDVAGPFYWPGSGPMLPLPGWDSQWKCRAMMTYKYYLLALGMIESGQEYPYKVRWSDAAAEGEVPSEWVATASNQAGSDLLGETPGHIIGGAQVLDSAWIVKEDAIYSCDWVGGGDILQLKMLKPGLGTNIHRGFTHSQGTLILATQKDVVAFNGAQVQSFVEGRVKHALENNISDEFWPITQVFSNTSNSIIMIAGAKAGSDGTLTDAYVYDLGSQTWGHRELRHSYGFGSARINLEGQGVQAYTWDQLGGPVPNPLPTTGWVPGKVWDEQTLSTWNQTGYDPKVPDILIYEGDEGNTAWWLSALLMKQATDVEGQPLYAKLERTGFPLEGSNGIAVVNGMHLDIDTEVPIQVSVGGQDGVNTAPRWSSPFILMPGKNYVPLRVSGRYIGMRFESVDQVGAWRLGAITLDWEKDGNA